MSSTTPELDQKSFYTQIVEKWLCPTPAKNQRFWLSMIILSALTMRIIAAVMHGVHVDRDTFTFAEQAMALADGQWSQWFYIHTKPPVFPMLIAGLVKLGIDALLAARIISLVAGMVMLHPIWLLTGRVHKGPVRLLTLAAVSLFLLEVRISGRGISDTVYACILLYGFYLTICKGLIDRKIIPVFIGGALLGIAFLTRSEAIMYLPLIPIISLVYALRKKITWKFAAATLLYPVIAIAVLAPQVYLLSQHEGKFMLRRNAMNFIEQSIDETIPEAGKPQPEKPKTEAKKSPIANLSKVAITSIKNIWDYAKDKLPRSMSYAGFFFFIIGLGYRRKKILGFTDESMFLMFFFWTILALSPMDAHSRFLTAHMGLIALTTAFGMVVFTAWLVEKNPGKISAEKQKTADRTIIAILLLCLAIPAAEKVLSRSFYESRELVAAGELIKADRTKHSAQPETVACAYGMIAYKAQAPKEHFFIAWKKDASQIRKLFTAKPKIGYWAIQKDQLEKMAPELLESPLPNWLESIGKTDSHPKHKEKRTLLIFRIRRENLK